MCNMCLMYYMQNISLLYVCTYVCNFSNIIIILEDLVDGLAQNDLDHYTHLLTGYIGSASFLERVASLVTTLKAKNPNLTYGTLSFNNDFYFHMTKFFFCIIFIIFIIYVHY